MNYQEFRDLWHDALQTARLPIPYPIGPNECINLSNMSRTYELVLFGGPQPKFEPFHIAASIQWDWDAVLSARYATTEEDMLMQIFGDFGIHEDTAPPWLRMDVCLSASVPYGTIFPMPGMAQWRRWVKRVGSQLQEILPTLYDGELLICACRGEPQATVKCLGDGQFSLEKLTFEAWQLILLPRQWDDPEKSDPDPEQALTDFANRIAKAMIAWENSLVHLVGDKAR